MRYLWTWAVTNFLDRFSLNCSDMLTRGLRNAVFHGGWWRSFEPALFSHTASGLNAHGGVALAAYNLCPLVGISDIIIAEMRRTRRTVAPLSQALLVIGHSAGGHLTAIETAWIGPRPAVAFRSLEIRLDLPKCGASWNFQNPRSFAASFATLLRRNGRAATIVSIRGDSS
jgi:hypothetical protein